MENENGINKINLNLANIPDVFERMQEGLTHGHFEGPEVFAFIKTLEDGIKKIKSQAQELSFEKMEESPDGTVTAFGVKMKQKNNGVTWNYSGSEEWKELDKAKKTLESKLKLGDYVNPETGEMSPQATSKPKASSIQVVKEK